jgi:hypothetical protein
MLKEFPEASSVAVVPAVCRFSDVRDHADAVEAERKPESSGLRYADYLHLNELLGAASKSNSWRASA